MHIVSDFFSILTKSNSNFHTVTVQIEVWLMSHNLHSWFHVFLTIQSCVWRLQNCFSLGHHCYTLMLQGVSKLNHEFIIRHVGNLILEYDNQVQQINELVFTITQICSFILRELLDFHWVPRYSGTPFWMVNRLSVPEAWVNQLESSYPGWVLIYM